MDYPGSYTEDRELYFNGTVSVTERVKYFIQRVDRKQHLNAFVKVYEEEALERAELIDNKIRNRTAGRLAGMVVALKDNIAWKDHSLSAASNILEGYFPTYNATVVERLLAEDAIILGHLNCDEFAMGSANELSRWGRVQNPHDHSRTTGGSSGGPAAAVAAGLCHATLGSDTGGSVRQPAAFCGVWGMKPTYGSVSRYGLVTYASTLDQIGPLTSSPKDMLRIMEGISGPDGKDHTLVNHSPLDEAINAIGYFEETLAYQELDPEIKNFFFSLLDGLAKRGVEIKPLASRYSNYLLPLYNVITTAEAATNLERYDGIRYGNTKEGENWQQSVKATRTAGFGPEIKRKIMMGNTVLLLNEKHGFYDQATRIRTSLKRETDKIFSNVQAILSPTAPTIAHKAYEKQEVIERYLADIYTFHANLTGIPALNIPVWKHSSGMPFGMQIAGKPFSDRKLLQFAENVTSVFEKV